jgi:protein-disulfide isomerase
MLNSRFFMGLGLAIALLAANKPIAAGQEDQTVVAEVGGHKITAEELHQKEASNLLQAQYKYYLAERQALDQLVDKELLEIQAAKEGVTVDELLKRHVTIEVKEPTEDQLKFYYEGLNTEEPYEAVRTNILDTVKQLREKKGRTAYVNTLRSDLGVVIELNQPSAKVDVTNAERIGSPSAPVQIVEFADYQCPYCQKVHPALAKLQEQLGDKVSVVFKDFPLPMHSNAEKASEAARCAGAQGKFWQFHDALFDNKKFGLLELKAEAHSLNLDQARFDKCLDSGEEADAVHKDLAEGQKLGITGTPSFFVNGHFLSGAISYAKLQETVQQELTAPSAPKQSAALSVNDATVTK